MSTPLEIKLMVQLQALVVQLKAANMVVPPNVSKVIAEAEEEIGNPISSFEETLSRVSALGCARNLHSSLDNDYCETPYTASLLDYQVAKWIIENVDFCTTSDGLDAVVDRVWEEIWKLQPDGFREDDLYYNADIVGELLRDANLVEEMSSKWDYR